MNFDEQFTSWVELHKSDPDAFDTMQHSLIKDQLQEFSDNGISRNKVQRMEASYWQMNHKLSKIKNPTARLNEAIRLFFIQHDSFSAALNDNANGTKHTNNVLAFGRGKRT